MRIRPIFLLLSLLITACLQTPLPVDSGIEGTVMIGPMCPVMQLNDPCLDQPYQATLTVLTTNGKEIAQFQTDEQGHFRVDLAPGAYILHPESPNSLPFALDMLFTVDEQQFTQLEINYDSGIR